MNEIRPVKRLALIAAALLFSIPAAAEDATLPALVRNVLDVR